MFTVLKSWLLGARAPLYLSATPATGRLTLAERHNDEVSIAFIRADVNAPPTAARGHGQAVVAIYRSRQSREEYLGEWLAAQAEIGRHARSCTAGNGRGDTGGQPPAGSGRGDAGGQLPTGNGGGDTGGQPPPCCGEARVPTASHDRREALRPHNRRNPPARPLRPGRLRGPQRSGDTSMDLDRPARNLPPGEGALPVEARRAHLPLPDRTRPGRAVGRRRGSPHRDVGGDRRAGTVPIDPGHGTRVVRRTRRAAMPQGRRVAGSQGRRGRRVAGSQGRRVVGSQGAQGRRVVGSSGRRVAGAPIPPVRRVPRRA
ncbi:hypothetical protein OJJOAM_004964 [Cupriavidus sp. H18C1]